jgi:diaminopimelate epimerase
MSTIHFFKYQGAGNDFIILDAITFPQYLGLKTNEIELLCDRHFGIGADGLMILDNSDIANFDMIYYNSDGKRSTMCGNGGRCIVALANHLGYIKKHCSFSAIDGIHEAEVLDHEQIRITLNVEGTPTNVNEDYVLNTGSPHYVRFVENLDRIDMMAFGRSIRYSQLLIEDGINVNAVEILKEGKLQIRTYERGVENETLACGTGVTAAAIVYKYVNPHMDLRDIDIIAKGGELKVFFDHNYLDTGQVFLEGPAKQVFKGIIDI